MNTKASMQNQRQKQTTQQNNGQIDSISRLSTRISPNKFSPSRTHDFRKKKHPKSNFKEGFFKKTSITYTGDIPTLSAKDLNFLKVFPQAGFGIPINVDIGSKSLTDAIKTVSEAISMFTSGPDLAATGSLISHASDMITTDPDSHEFERARAKTQNSILSMLPGVTWTTIGMTGAAAIIFGSTFYSNWRNPTATKKIVLLISGMIWVLAGGGVGLLIHMSSLGIFEGKIPDEFVRHAEAAFSASVSPQSGDIEMPMKFFDLFNSQFLPDFKMKDVTNTMNCISACYRAKEPLEALCNFLIKYFMDAVNYVRNEWLGLDSLDWVTRTADKHIDEYLRISKDLYERSLSNQFPNNKSNYDHLRSVIYAGEKLYKDIPNSNKMHGTKTILNNELFVLRKMYKAMADSNFSYEGLRQEPTVLLMRGIPGVGKSTLIENFINLSASYTLGPDEMKEYLSDRSKFIYNRAHEQDFFSGYTPKKKFVIFDDFGQSIDSSGNPNSEGMNFIRCANGFNYEPHMDELHLKGTTKFTSPFIFLTTNRESFEFNSIISQTAIRRRFDVSVRVVPKLCYCVQVDGQMDRPFERVIDDSKLPSGNHAKTRLDASIVEFHLLNKMTDKPTLCPLSGKSVLDFFEVAALLKSVYIEKVNRFLDYTETLQDEITTIINNPDVDFLQQLKPRGLVSETVVARVNTSQIKAHELKKQYLSPIEIRLRECVAQAGSEYFDAESSSLDQVYPEITMNDLSSFISSTNTSKYFQADIGSVSDASSEACCSNFQNCDCDSSDFDELDGLFSDGTESDSSGFSQSTIVHAITVDEAKFIARIHSMYTDPKNDSYRKNFGIMQLYVKSHPNWHQLYDDRFDDIIIAAHRMRGDRISCLKFLVDGTAFSVQKAGDSILRSLDDFKEMESNMPTMNFGFSLPAPPSSNVLLSIKQKWKQVNDRIEAKFPFYKVVRKWAPTIISLLVFFAGGSLIVKSIFNAIFPSYYESEAQSVSFAPKTTVKTRQKGMRIPRRTVQAQTSASHDTSGIEIMRSIIRRNCYEMCIESTDGSYSKWGFVTFLKGHVAFIPSHFTKFIEDRVEDQRLTHDHKIRFQKFDRDSVVRTVYMTVLEYLETYECCIEPTIDLSLIVLPSCKFPNHKDITEYLPTEDSFLRTKVFKVILCSPSIERVLERHGECVATNQQTKVTIPLTKDQRSRGCEDHYYINSSFIYDMHTDNGDCGSVLFVGNKSLSKEKIWGFHVAGNGVQGHSTTVTQDMVKYIFEQPDGIAEQTQDIVIDDELPPHLVEAQGPSPISGFELEFTTPYKSFVPTKTKIFPSKMVLPLPPFTKPAHLTRFRNVLGKEIDPIAISLQGYSNSVIPIVNRPALDRSTRNLVNHLVRSSSVPVFKIYTFEEAVAGIEDTTWDSISTKSSVGFPLKQQGQTKHSIFGKVGFDFERPQAKALKVEVLSILAKANRGIRCYHISTEFPKDERRPIDKVELGKTRNISGGSLAFFIAMRMVFGSFQTWIVDNRVKNGITTGVNVYDPIEWTSIADRLQRFCSGFDDPNLDDGDYQAFDKSHIPEFSNEILVVIETILEMFPEAESTDSGVFLGFDFIKIRHVFWQEIITSRHLVDGKIFSWVGSMSSGNPLTTLINNLYSHIAFRYCYHVRFPEPEAPEFTTVFELQTHGDDSAYSADDCIKEDFNGSHIKVILKSIGMGFTSASKGDSGSTYKPIGDITFLKRRWARHPQGMNLYVAPMDLNTVLDICRWTVAPDSLNCDLIAISNVDVTLRELSLHGKDVFRKWFPIINKQLGLQYKKTPKFSFWMDYFQWTCSTEMIF